MLLNSVYFLHQSDNHIKFGHVHQPEELVLREVTLVSVQLVCCHCHMEAKVTLGENLDKFENLRGFQGVSVSDKF